ncbi:hypothetical protein ABT061_08595 [Streptosporangium sp. NPDC002544]|uniref:hypothetical protein n=1 Tax=Streptosporangium sp. NPDC002544 TaxID=3154538 RepID=UPI00332D4A4D
MTELAYILDGLRCAACHAVNTLWLDLIRGLVECRECGQGALLDPDHEQEADA